MHRIYWSQFFSIDLRLLIFWMRCRGIRYFFDHSKFIHVLFLMILLSVVLTVQIYVLFIWEHPLVSLKVFSPWPDHLTNIKDNIKLIKIKSNGYFSVKTVMKQYNLIKHHHSSSIRILLIKLSSWSSCCSDPNESSGF